MLVCKILLLQTLVVHGITKSLSVHFVRVSYSYNIRVAHQAKQDELQKGGNQRDKKAGDKIKELDRVQEHINFGMQK